MREGAVVVVTGATGGIGTATCRRLARDGYCVRAVDRDPDSLDRLIRDLDGSGHRATAVDLSATSEFTALVDDAAAERPLAGMVHMAAILRRRSHIDEVTEDDWDAQLDTNLKATFFLDRAIARKLIQQGTGGSIVNFASQGWWSGGYGGSVVYAASKGGVVSLSRGLARSLAQYQIRVNVIAPGFVDTAMMRQDMSDRDLAQAVEQVPLGRLATPEEVADTTAFLIGPDSRYMTGTTMNVSGGQLMY